VCETKSLALSVTAPNIVTYLWQGPQGFAALTKNVGRDSCNLLYSGMYKVIVLDVNACSSFATTSITIYSNPTISALSSTVCYKNPAVLKAEGGVNYWWYNSDGFYVNQTNALISSAINTAAVVYTVVGAALNTCTSIATATLGTLPLPKPYLTVTPASKQVCVSDIITFSGFGAYGYDWSGPDQFRFSGQTASFVVTSTGYTGPYNLLAKDINGCVGTASTFVQVYDLPLGNLDGNMKGCAPLCISFLYYPPTTGAPVVNTSFVLAGKTFTSNKFTHCISTPGDYLVRGHITDANGCVNTNTYLVNVFPLPEPNFATSPEKPIEKIDEVVFENTTSKGGPLVGWTWYVGNNEDFGINKKFAGRFFDEAGIYPVAMVAKNVFGCSDTVVKVVKIEEDFSLYVPNSFSPNGDGINDEFLPVTRGIKHYDLKIFNRWGQLVFSTTNPNISWKAIFNDEECKSDIYIWKITAGSIHGQIKEMTGHLTLFR
jgi:gliding motility-associated-like protein